MFENYINDQEITNQIKNEKNGMEKFLKKTYFNTTSKFQSSNKFKLF